MLSKNDRKQLEKLLVLTNQRIEADKRLKYLKEEILAERISYSEIAELQSLKKYIDPSDTLLLKWAGTQEGQEKYCTNCVMDIETDNKGNCIVCGKYITE